jgi:hypothetical protein
LIEEQNGAKLVLCGVLNEPDQEPYIDHALRIRQNECVEEHFAN